MVVTKFQFLANTDGTLVEVVDLESYSNRDDTDTTMQ
jgi:hypothetical protein